MREFFRGWRRKAGLVTLGLALVLLGMWIRGFAVEDVVRLGDGQGRVTRGKVLNTLSSSSRNGFTWTREAAANQSFAWRAGWQTHPTEKALTFDPKDYVGSDVADWRWQLRGLDFGRCHSPNGDKLLYWHLSYFPVVTTLTLLSGYLLLWKPRKRPTTASQPHA